MAIKPFAGATIGIDDSDDTLVIYDPRTSAVLLKVAADGSLVLADDYNLRQVAPEGQETEWSMQLEGEYDGAIDLQEYDNPTYVIGRIVAGNYAPKLRFLYRDDQHSEGTVMEWEYGATFAMVLQGDRSIYEAFYEGESNPVFRIGADRTDGNYLEFQTTSDANNYVRIRRDATNKRLEVVDPQNSDAAADLSFGVWYNNANGNLYLGGTLIASFYSPAESSNEITVNAWSSRAIKIDFSATTGDVTVKLNYPTEGARWSFIVTQDTVARAISWEHQLGAGFVSVTPKWPGGTAYSGTASGIDIIDMWYAGGTTYYAEFRAAYS